MVIVAISVTCCGHGELRNTSSINDILNEDIYSPKIVRTERKKIAKGINEIVIKEEKGGVYTVKEKIPYNEFLKKLNKQTGFSLPLLHKGFVVLSQKMKFPEDFFNSNTLGNIVKKYQEWLEKTYINRFSYQKMNIMGKLKRVFFKEILDCIKIITLIFLKSFYMIH